MPSEKLIELLEEAVRGELQVSIQYMWQHVLWKGIKGLAVKEDLEKIAISEMKHAERIAERLAYFGKIPPTLPYPINIGSTLKEMMEQDIRDEEKTIKLYKEIIKIAQQEEDFGTLQLFQQILKDEEEHHDFFLSVLEEL